MTQLRQREDEIEALNIAVVVVTFELGYMAQAYASETNLVWPLVVDESRELYAAYDMERGRSWDIYGPPAWLIYMKLLAKGRTLKRTSGDINQLGGDVLIDPSGVVRMHYVGSGPADRPTVESLLAAVKNGSSISR